MDDESFMSLSCRVNGPNVRQLYRELEQVECVIYSVIRDGLVCPNSTLEVLGRRNQTSLFNLVFKHPCIV